MAITSIQAEVTKTAVFNGAGVDISALTAPFEFLLVVDVLTAGSVAQFELQTSTDSFSSDIRVEKQWNVKGPAATTYPTGLSVHRYDLPGFRNGTTSAHARLALTYIDSASSVSYSASILN